MTTDDLTSNEFEQPPQKEQRQTLMDFAKVENHWPTFKNNKQASVFYSSVEKRLEK